MTEETTLITNAGSEPADLIVEPWGERVPLDAQECVRLLARGRDINVEVVHEGALIAAYVSPEVTVKVFRGSELACDLDLGFPASALPSGWTIRDFIDGVFGGPGKAGDA
ncbi:MAG TPA: hypothetical protein VLL54_13335 [Pyrinomonadaceae bacterium]|nr:hypothetical protein [Pyrinomonadaceae bacterium]